MKRTLLALLGFSLFAAPIARAQFTYTTENGTITITGYYGSGGAVVIPDTINGLPVTRIGTGAFEGSKNLTNVTIPNSVTSINPSAFANCTSLASVTIPGSVADIWFHAFAGCTSLASVTIPKSVTIVDVDVFDYCTSLTEINVAAQNPNYGSLDGVVFDKSKAQLVCFPPGRDANYTIPNTVTNIQADAFATSANLTSVTIPEGVTSIGEAAFSYVTSPASITIPDSVTSLGGSAFSGCGSLTNVTIGAGVTNIEELAFAGCTSLASVTIPKNVTNIKGDAFAFCTSLTEINVAAQNPYYSSLDGVVFDKSQAQLVCFPAGRGGNYTVPTGVTSVGAFAFSWGRVASVTIPATLTNIGSSAFEFCGTSPFSRASRSTPRRSRPIRTNLSRRFSSWTAIAGRLISRVSSGQTLSARSNPAAIGCGTNRRNEAGSALPRPHDFCETQLFQQRFKAWMIVQADPVVVVEKQI
jgi:hypothetical protein